jgi:hypothetical protein
VTGNSATRKISIVSVAVASKKRLVSNECIVQYEIECAVDALSSTTEREYYSVVDSLQSALTSKEFQSILSRTSESYGVSAISDGKPIVFEPFISVTIKPSTEVIAQKVSADNRALQSGLSIDGLISITVIVGVILICILGYCVYRHRAKDRTIEDEEGPVIPSQRSDRGSSLYDTPRRKRDGPTMRARETQDDFGTTRKWEIAVLPLTAENLRSSSSSRDNSRDNTDFFHFKP